MSRRARRGGSIAAGACLLLALSTLCAGCNHQPPDATPDGVVRFFLDEMENASDDPRLMRFAEGGSDPYVPLAGRVEGYSDDFLAAIDSALSVLPKDRVQTARDWLALMSRTPELKVVPLKK